MSLFRGGVWPSILLTIRLKPGLLLRLYRIRIRKVAGGRKIREAIEVWQLYTVYAVGNPTIGNSAGSSVPALIKQFLSKYEPYLSMSSLHWICALVIVSLYLSTRNGCWGRGAGARGVWQLYMQRAARLLILSALYEWSEHGYQFHGIKIYWSTWTMDIYHIPTFAKKSTCLKGYCQFREGPPHKKKFFKFSQICEPTHLPHDFCEILWDWEHKRWNLGQKRRDFFRGLDFVWESDFPKKAFFWDLPFYERSTLVSKVRLWLGQVD